jgi:hypothetical protein
MTDQTLAPRFLKMGINGTRVDDGTSTAEAQSRHPVSLYRNPLVTHQQVTFVSLPVEALGGRGPGTKDARTLSTSPGGSGPGLTSTKSVDRGLWHSLGNTHDGQICQRRFIAGTQIMNDTAPSLSNR